MHNRVALRSSLFVTVLAFAAMSCSTTRMARPLSIDDLSTDEKIGQLIVPDAYGAYMSDSSAAWKRLEHLVRDEHVGGLVWFATNVYETAFLNRKLQSLAKVPLLIPASRSALMRSGTFASDCSFRLRNAVS